jgi:hypothetical protein
VVLPLGWPHRKEESPAEQQALEILSSRGKSERQYRNTLIFLAADARDEEELSRRARDYLAWSSIVDDYERLDLTESQRKQAIAERENQEKGLLERTEETWRWLLVPGQPLGSASPTLALEQLRGNGTLAKRAFEQAKKNEQLVTALGASALRNELDRVPLWRGDQVSIGQLKEDFGRYLYLPRLQSTELIEESVSAGLAMTSWSKDSFALTDSYDEAAQRYRGLRVFQRVPAAQIAESMLLVRPQRALEQLAAEEQAPAAQPASPPELPVGSPAPVDPQPEASSPAVRRPKRFRGSVTLRPDRLGRDAGEIGEHVVSQLTSLSGSQVTVRLEIEGSCPDGVPEEVVRTAKENSAHLHLQITFEDE